MLKDEIKAASLVGQMVEALAVEWALMMAAWRGKMKVDSLTSAQKVEKTDVTILVLKTSKLVSLSAESKTQR